MATKLANKRPTVDLNEMLECHNCGNKQPRREMRGAVSGHLLCSPCFDQHGDHDFGSELRDLQVIRKPDAEEVVRRIGERSVPLPKE